MKISESRILTTHCGSLPRSERLSDLLLRDEDGEEIDKAMLAQEVADGVRSAIRAQLDAGIDIVSDGEQPRVGFSTYVAQRMTGFGGISKRPSPKDFDDFPEFAVAMRARVGRRNKIGSAPQAVGEVSYTGLDMAKAECDLFKTSLAEIGAEPVDRFMTAASPGIIATTMLNAYYDTHERYVFALADELRKEYELIASYGFVLQLDAPDLGLERARLFKDRPATEFMAAMETHIEGINRAVAGIPRHQIRLHCCWGNWEGPHIHDVPLSDLLPLLYRAHVGALSIEFANPRHQHEYEALRRNPLPSDMVLIPGVIDTTTNFVEHPEVVANRLCEAVAAVGDRSRVIASNDCGFGTSAGARQVTTDVVRAKLKACREGADIATRRLWSVPG